MTYSMASLLKKTIHGKTYYYARECRRVDGKPKIVQLVGLHLTEVTVKGSWAGPARLHLVPHVNAPVADLPVRKVLGGLHFIADLTLPGGQVLHDYMKS